MQAAGDIPTLDTLASAEAASGGKGAMSARKGEGIIGAGKPGEPLRGVGRKSKDAFVGIDHLRTAIGGEGNHGNGARWGAGWRRGIKDRRKGSDAGGRSAHGWRRKRGR